MIYKETTPSGELYIYMNGVLLYKRWSSGVSAIFEKYGPPTISSYEMRKKVDSDRTSV